MRRRCPPSWSVAASAAQPPRWDTGPLRQRRRHSPAAGLYTLLHLSGRRRRLGNGDGSTATLMVIPGNPAPRRRRRDNDVTTTPDRHGHLGSPWAGGEVMWLILSFCVEVSVSKNVQHVAEQNVKHNHAYFYFWH